MYNLFIQYLFHSDFKTFPLWQLPVCFLCLWVCFCFVSFLSFFIHFRNHTVFVFLLYFSVSIITYRSICFVANGKISFFSCLGNIPLCVCVHIYIYIYIYIYTHYTASLSTHVGCFHILAIMNNAAITIGCTYFFQISVFISPKYSKV